MPPARAALYLATGVALASAARAVVASPPPLPWALGILAGYGVLVLGGVFVLPWQVYADAVLTGPPGSRGIALTFDDGPHPRWTPAVLDILAERGLRATFFVVGCKVEQHPALVQEMVSRGHAVELHSYGHDRLFALRTERRVREDLERGIVAIERATGRRPRLFRPPIGHTNPTIARVADDLELVVVGWSARGLDGLPGARPDAVVARVGRGLRDGAIVLLHDANERGDAEPAIVRALPRILDAVASQGLEVVPLHPWTDGYGCAGDAGSTT